MGLDIFFNKCKTKQIGYFRKVNFLVGFFENKGMDIENQRPIDVSKEDVEELIDKCEGILNGKLDPEEELPTREGFFFGSCSYNENYYEDVKNVLEYCKETLLPYFDDLDNGERIEFAIWY